MGNQYPPDPRTGGGEQWYGNPNEETTQVAEANNVTARRQRRNYTDPAGGRVETRQETVEDKNLSRANARNWIRGITYFLLSVLEVVLLLRLLFHLLGANTESPFVSFLYSLSKVFVGPFNGIFNDQALGRGVSVFEWSTVIAMLIYALIAWGIVSLGNVLFAPVLSGRDTVTTTRRRA